VLEFFTERPYAHLADATAAIWERFDVNVSVKSVIELLMFAPCTNIVSLCGDIVETVGKSWVLYRGHPHFIC
jgi:hypothetical protein